MEDLDLKEFLEWLERHAKLKADAYDGMNAQELLTSDISLRYATEELGEVSTAMTRARWNQALGECIDLAHSAFLIYASIKAENKLDGAK